MKDKEMIEHLERIAKCPQRVCEICSGWLLMIALALREREQ